MAIEGDNQKQADFLTAALAKVDPARIHDLHMVQSVLALPDHLTVTAKIPGIDPDTSAAGFEFCLRLGFFFKHCRKKPRRSTQYC